jgi:hypothetical protein
MTGLLRRALFLLALLACVGLAAPAWACPFCSMQGQTLTQEVDQAAMVLYGTLSNARSGPAGEFDKGETDLVLEKVIKSHKFVEGKKKVTLPRYIPPTKGNEDVRYLIFCDLFRGKIDPYRGMPVKTDDMPKYLEGALKVKDRKVSDRLRFFFDYLNNEDVEIANDALKEFGNAEYKDYHAMAADLPAEKVARWLKDPKTPAYRFGLYASILGHAGKNKHEYAKLLRSLVEDPEQRVSSGIDGILAGYVMLKPKEGWAYLRGILGDTSKEFLMRYAALRAVRFFVDFRPDVVPLKDSVEAVSLLLDQPDVADLAAEDLRKWKRWEMTDRILGLKDKESHDVPIIKRAILRFALCSPQKAAKAYVAEQRKLDEQSVLDAEELLRLEQTPPPATSATDARKK